MWIFLSDSMVSIVQKRDDIKRGTLTVRGRIKGDIERAFPGAVVQKGGGTDYAFRAILPREQVAKAMHDAVMGIDYSNFKDSCDSSTRHDVYMGVWRVMYQHQEKANPIHRGRYQGDLIGG